LPDASLPFAELSSLSDSLTGLTQRLQSVAAQQCSTLYFDYVGLTMFPANDVSVLKQCVAKMISEGISQSASGSGSLFLSVYAWPLSIDKARVTVQLAYTDTSSTRDLGRLSSMFGDVASPAACDSKDMPSIDPDGLSTIFSDGVDAACERHVSGDAGALIVLSLSLPHSGPEIEPSYLIDLATVSAWLIGSLSEEEALLAIRLQRDGWLVRQFDDLEDALGFWASHKNGLEPALVIATEQAKLSWQALLKARGAWSPQCRVIYGVRSDHLFSSLQPERGIEVRKIPFSPADLREIKELASVLEASRNQASQSNKRNESRARPTALVVDDDPINRVLAKEMLHVFGYECDTATNGREAVEYVERYRPDVVLMDLDMPVMNGMEATERIRRYEMHDQPGGCAPVTIIATTARDKEDVSRSWGAMGMSAFVPKPLMMPLLAAALPNHARRPSVA
jgi:CheY-like chemotaxis protein